MEETKALTAKEIFDQIVLLQKQLTESSYTSLHRLGDTITSLGSEDSELPEGYIDAAKEVCKVFAFRENTFQRVLAFYEKMYDDIVNHPCTESGTKKGNNQENDKDGDKYAEAIRIAIEENNVSTSLLQRKLGIGYSRAAKIIDRMEEEGLVSEPNGSQPRAVLITAEQFAKRYAEGNVGQTTNV